MIPPTKQGVTLPPPMDPVIETERLILRRWRDADVAPNTEMLADPATARFITSDGKAVTDAFVGWRNAAIMAGHWALHGFGLFVVEEKQTGRYVGRVVWVGRALKSAGVSPRAFAARATRSRPRRRPSIGSLRVLRSTGSSTPSARKTSHHKRWHNASEQPSNARSNCSTMSRIYG